MHGTIDIQVLTYTMNLHHISNIHIRIHCLCICIFEYSNDLQQDVVVPVLWAHEEQRHDRFYHSMSSIIFLSVLINII
jgi:hypothetical protein